MPGFVAAVVDTFATPNVLRLEWMRILHAFIFIQLQYEKRSGGGFRF